MHKKLEEQIRSSYALLQPLLAMVFRDVQHQKQYACQAFMFDSSSLQNKIKLQ